MVIYFVFVLLLTFFYTEVLFEQQNYGENLKRQGAQIPGVVRGAPDAEIPQQSTAQNYACWSDIPGSCGNYAVFLQFDLAGQHRFILVLDLRIRLDHRCRCRTGYI